MLDIFHYFWLFHRQNNESIKWENPTLSQGWLSSVSFSIETSWWTKSDWINRCDEMRVVWTSNTWWALCISWTGRLQRWWYLSCRVLMEQESSINPGFPAVKCSFDLIFLGRLSDTWNAERGCSSMDELQPLSERYEGGSSSGSPFKHNFWAARSKKVIRSHPSLRTV